MRKFFFLLAAIVSLNLMATEGALPGAFTINANGDKIQFSQGNLQYQASTDTWQFAENQKDTMVFPNIDANGEFTETLLWRDRIAFLEYLKTNNNLYNNGWRVLKPSEWEYILVGRTNADNLKAAATVDETEGYLLLPDNWQNNEVNFVAGGSTVQNVYNTQQWVSLESSGAVFFPFVNAYGIKEKEYKESGTFVYTKRQLEDSNIYWTDSCKTISSSQIDYYGSQFLKDGTARKIVITENRCISCEEDTGESIETINTQEKFYCAIRFVKDADPTEAIDQITNGKSSNRKFIIDGQLLIERGGKTYNAQGAEVK